MHRVTLIHPTSLLLALTGIAIAGCESPDRRLADFAQRATEQQARQNEHLAAQSAAATRLNQELAAAAHKLVEQDAAARRELIQAQDKLQEQSLRERSDLNQQRAHLEMERKTAAAGVVRDPIIAQAIIMTGLIGAALLPLLVTVYALRRLPEQRPLDELWGDALLEVLVTGNPAGRLPHSSQPMPPGFSRPRLDGPSAGPAAGAEHQHAFR
jgi:hypothetical protein